MPDTVIILSVRRLRDVSLVAELRAELPRSRADLGSSPITISDEALRSLETIPDAYGGALSAMVFPPALREAWERARGAAEASGDGLQVRVVIDDPGGTLHSLRWELLRDPATNKALARQEAGSLARLVPVAEMYDAPLTGKPELRALVAVAGPSDTARWGLAPVDVAAEAGRVLEALGDIRAELLAGDQPRSTGPATLANIRNSLRGGKHILYLIGHGKATEKGSVLYLVDDDGKTAPISGESFAAEIAALDSAHRPLLVVLVACESAEQQATPLASLGPLLARAGIPAVVAMQTTVTMDAAARFTKQLLVELAREGRIDQALAAARKEMGGEWWVPVLWLRIHDGLLWRAEPNHETPSAGGDQAEELRQRLENHRATLNHYLNQLAIAGSANVRPEVMHGIREARNEIRRLKAQLRAKGQAVEDGPDDEG